MKAANPLPYLPSEYSKIYGTVGIVEMTQAPYSCKVDRLRSNKSNNWKLGQVCNLCSKEMKLVKTCSKTISGTSHKNQYQRFLHVVVRLIPFVY